MAALDKPEEVVVEESQSAFAKANFGPVVLIQLMRLYDLQLAFLSSVDPEKAEQIVELHSQGMTFCPAPKFVLPESDDNVPKEA